MSTLDARDNLNHIAHHWADLQHQLGGLKSTPTDKITVKSSSDPQAPINLHVLDLTQEIHDWAWWAVHQLETHAGVTWPMPVLRWDSNALRHLAQHHECWDGVDDFEHAAQRFRRKTDKALRNAPQRQYMGPCPTRGPNGDGCSGHIYITPGSTTAACPICDAHVPARAQQEYIRTELDNVLMTPTEIAQALSALGHRVKRRSVYDWIERGKMTAQEPGLYKLNDAILLASQTT